MKTVAFGDLLELPLRSGFTVPAASRGDGIKMLNMGELFRYPRIPAVDMARVGIDHTDSERTLLQAGDLMFARRSLTLEGAGKCAIVHQVDEPTTWESSIIRARMDQAIADAPYYFYYFASLMGRRQVETIVEQVAAAGIRLSELRSLKVPVPPLAEQRGIAEVLGALDDKIAANAVSHEAASRLAIALAQSDQSVRLDQVADQVKGTVAPASFGAALVDHFSLPAFDVGAGPEVVAGATIKSNKTRVAGNTVLISKLNPRFPRIWDVIQTDDSRPALASTEFIPVTSKLIPSSVLWAALSAPEFASALESKVAGTSGSHQRVKPADLLATEIADPRSLSAGAVASIASLGQIRAALTKETAELVATRDALLPLLMSGRVTVKAAESVVGEVL